MAIGATQKWYAGAGVASVAVLAAGWFLLVSPQQANAADIQAQTARVEAANRASEAQIASLKAQFKDLPQLESQVAAIRTHIPVSPNEPTLLRTLTAAAKKAGVNLTAIQVQPPAAISGSAGATGTDPLVTAGQVSQLPITMQLTGTFANTRLFLNALEGMQRSMLVTGLDVTRGEGAASGTGLATSVTARVFMASPGSSPAVGAATTPAGTSPATQPS